MICNCTLAGTDACNNCPNSNQSLEKTYKYNLMIDNMIKDVKPIKGFPVIQYWCSQCDALLNKYDKYCHNCGIEIDWEMMTD